MATWTFEKLYKSTISFKQWRRSYSQNDRMNIAAIIPYKGTKSVLFQGSCFGRTQKSIHKTNLLFSGVEIIEENSSMTDETRPNLIDYIKVEHKRKTYYIQKIDPRKHGLTVRCTCADFFYRFAWYNHEKGALYGPKPRPYRRVPGSTRPPQNPGHFAGMCKHIYNLYSFMRASGYTVEQGYYR